MWDLKVHDAKVTGAYITTIVDHEDIDAGAEE